MHDIPELTLDVLEETGVFAAVPNQGDESDRRAWDMKMHLLGCVRAVVGYEPVPLPLREGKRLGMGNVVVVWATKGLFEELVGKVKEASELVGKRVGGGEGGFDGVGLSKDWLNATRTEFGPKGWDGLVGEVRECWSVEGDHFGIMKIPAVSILIMFQFMIDEENLEIVLIGCRLRRRVCWFNGPWRYFRGIFEYPGRST